MKYLLFLLGFIPGTNLFAKLELPSVFGDNAVLQCSEATRIRGKALPGQTVQIKLSLNLEQTVCADSQGQWETAFNLSGIPSRKSFSLSVCAGDEKITSHNLIAGEVWLCSGQSNMEKPVGHQKGQFPCIGWEETVQKSNDPLLRVFTVKRNRSEIPVENCEGEWRLASPENTPVFTAVGYYFARAIRRETKRPVGIIHSSWGGTQIQEWLSAQTLKAKPDLDKNAPKNKSTLYNGMIHPLKGITLAGFLWYQGEANCLQRKDMNIYPALLQKLIESWRAEHGGTELPFYGCQLAYFGPSQRSPGSDIAWSQLQIAQSKVFGVLPQTGLAVLTDIGEFSDIHPREKAVVGERLAKIALNQCYGKKIPYAGPVFSSAQMKGPDAILSFQTGAKSLKVLPVTQTVIMNARKSVPYTRLSPASQLEGFELLDENGQWVWANAKIEGSNQVRVNAKGVKTTHGVRYHVGDKVLGNLANNAGLPASPFWFEPETR